MDMIHDNGSVIVVAAGNGNRSCGPSPETISHNVSGIAQGVYYYLLEAGNERKLARFVVIH